jgi:hypothetical protein
MHLIEPLAAFGVLALAAEFAMSNIAEQEATPGTRRVIPMDWAAMSCTRSTDP